jgi:ferredoxin
MGLEVTVDPARCSGSGNCAYWAPGVFDVGDDGVAVVLTDPTDHADKVRLAAQHCPTAAISIASPSA